MEHEQQTVTNNAPTPSRTIRVSHEGDYNVSVNHGVTQADNGRRFLVFSTIEDAVQAYGELKAGDVKASYLTYSLFVKSQAELTEDSLRTRVNTLVPQAVLTYLRVDDNQHTGKVVVDLLTDYQVMKAASTDDLRFFHFDPKRVRPRRDQDQGENANVQQRQWQVQQRRPQGDRQGFQGRGSRGGDRPQGDRQGFQGRGGDRPQRPQGDRQGFQGRGGDRQQRPQGDREQRPQGDRQGFQGRGGRGQQRPQGPRTNNTNAV